MNEETKEKHFDFEIPHKCQYSVAKPFYGGETFESDCQMPAAYYGTWVDNDGNTVDKMWLCREHLEHILRCEKKYL